MKSKILSELVQDFVHFLFTFWTRFIIILGIKIASKRAPHIGPVLETRLPRMSGFQESPKRKINERGEKGKLAGNKPIKRQREMWLSAVCLSEALSNALAKALTKASGKCLARLGL